MAADYRRLSLLLNASNRYGLRLSASLGKPPPPCSHVVLHSIFQPLLLRRIEWLGVSPPVCGDCRSFFGDPRGCRSSRHPDQAHDRSLPFTIQRRGCIVLQLVLSDHLASQRTHALVNLICLAWKDTACIPAALVPVLFTPLLRTPQTLPWRASSPACQQDDVSSNHTQALD